MPFCKVGVENTSDIELYYEDLGSGRPVVLVHGWPLNGASWERQTFALLAAGFRVVTYDRRGFGRSDQPSEGYNYDTMAADLNALIEHLDLKDAALAGFSMAGGELARYLGGMNQGRVTKAAFISCITPYLRKSASNPEGVDPAVFEEMKQNIEKDRFAFWKNFFPSFYGKKMLGGTDVSDEAMENSARVAAQAQLGATLFCIDAWLEDFREDLKAIKLPTLVLHGDEDQTLPIASTGDRMSALVEACEYHVIKGGPHNVLWTHAAEVNTHLLRFLKS